MENISTHLSYKEVTKSNEAIRLGLDNTPSKEVLDNIKLLAEKVFEPLRVGINKPINVNSVYRSREVNIAIGGATYSQHCKGQAMDIDNGEDNKEIFDYIKSNLVFDQLIWEFGTTNNPDWVHVSYDGTINRKQILKSVKQGKKTVYVNF